MANNRMYIECTACAESDLLYLGKRMLDGYYNVRFAGFGAKRKFAQEMAEWFERHNHIDLRTQDHFRIIYECQNNYDIGTGIAALIEGKTHPIRGTG